MRRVIIRSLLPLLLAGCAASAPSLTNEGNRYLRQGRLDEAVASYQLAQVSDPDVSLSYFNAGVAFLLRSEWYMAESNFLQSLRHLEDESLRVPILFGLGESYFKQTNYRAAADVYRQILELAPDNDDARYNMELALLRIPTDTPVPSPTPTTTSTDSVSPMTATPTPTSTPTPDLPDPEGREEPTPTPTPAPENDGGQQETPEPTVPTEVVPPLDELSAIQLLDDVQQGQGVIQSQLSDSRSSSRPIDKDW